MRIFLHKSFALIIFTVLVFGFACVGMFQHTAASDVPTTNSRATLSVTHSQECCTASILEHIESWKDKLLSLPREAKDGLLLLLLALAIAFALGRFWMTRNPNDYHLFSYRLYIKNNPDFALFNHLKLAFAQGVLNPKIY
ncbi:MAG: hypothetical protein A2748_02535 [Candidatus Wildermuthbacteria bacterium RIFCSPHIGHO2_01_FULL_45_20]|nr:MAG: hypothetical protein A2748_02535 [Candidatus Wildermuthbacteria bacterium RIFCSPHIGHO2_01_FULL_45_20]